MDSVYGRGFVRTAWFLGMLVLASMGSARVFAQAAEAIADTGNLFSEINAVSKQATHSLSYFAQDWPDREQWRIKGRAQMQALLSYQRPAAPLQPQVLATVQKDGYRRLHVRYAVSPNRMTEAYLLLPDNLKKPAPAVIAIHDHGGFYYFGKEKITQVEDPPGILTRFIERSYGGRTYADELARQGFVVLVPDGFYFGSQRLDPSEISERFTRGLRGKQPNSDEYIEAFNRFAGDHETLVAKTIFAAGATWPGILFQGDRASVDFLLTREEVDGSRIGCIGLSIGGFRSAHLAGLDPRIKVAVVAGWMTTYDSLLRDHLRNHTWMIYVPRQQQFLDLPDVVALNAPRPLMVINCLQDQLFTLDGMQAAERKLRAIYAKMEAATHFECRYFDVPHSLNVEMQDAAIAWLSRWLK